MSFMAKNITEVAQACFPMQEQGPHIYVSYSWASGSVQSPYSIMLVTRNAIFDMIIIVPVAVLA